MAASDYVPHLFKNRLHLAGRPQMSTRPSPLQNYILVDAHCAPEQRKFSIDVVHGKHLGLNYFPGRCPAGL
jgi:hypothetical protein